MWAVPATILLVAGAAAAAVIAMVDGRSTDCFADFPSSKRAELALIRAHAAGLDDTDIVEHRRSASIRISSGETGDDAREFRRTVRGLVRDSGGHLERNTPCIERPFFN